MRIFNKQITWYRGDILVIAKTRQKRWRRQKTPRYVVFSLQVIASGKTIIITGNGVNIVQRYKKLWELRDEDHLHLLSMKVNWEALIPTSQSHHSAMFHTPCAIAYATLTKGLVDLLTTFQMYQRGIDTIYPVCFACRPIITLKFKKHIINFQVPKSALWLERYSHSTGATC